MTLTTGVPGASSVVKLGAAVVDPYPELLYAITFTVYVEFFKRPVVISVVNDGDDTSFVNTCALVESYAVTLYLVMVAPPSVDGLVQVTVHDVDKIFDTETLPGGPGVLAWAVTVVVAVFETPTRLVA
jgi:hypothetical protein